MRSGVHGGENTILGNTRSTSGTSLTNSFICSVIGSMLWRSQGRRVWARFRQTVERGGMPHREVIDGVLVIFGGAFLITPGFISDVVGIVLLLPPTRAMVRRLLIRRLGKRIQL